MTKLEQRAEESADNARQEKFPIPETFSLGYTPDMALQDGIGAGRYELGYKDGFLAGARSVVDGRIMRACLRCLEYGVMKECTVCEGSGSVYLIPAKKEKK